MRRPLHRECCFTPSWPTLPTSERPDGGGSPHESTTLILIILLLAGGIIYATFACNPMSFDDLIELRFLPSRRRHRDPEYFEQLKSMTLPREVSYRVSREDSRA